MNDFSDFLDYGYRVERELGSNRAGGRVTYLATAIATEATVVIKQFQFARSSVGWSGYDAYHREIDVLRGLEHRGIPRYLDSFQTEAGFCMVQEYKPALPLSVTRSFSAEEVRQIAVSALEILIYLQNRLPPVIHRDVKPENILVDEQINVYLVDFGFARVGDGEVGVSSVVKGTLGFMPPEQLFNRQLTEASDLYGLGLTLICLLTKTKTDEIGNLVDISYRVSFKHLVSKLSPHWINWLEKMVEPKVKDRFANAAAALNAMPKTPLRLPEVQLSASQLQFTATRLREPLTQTIRITNLVPDTLLEGHLEVATHVSDPPHTPDAHTWIQIQPARFSANEIDCQILIHTQRLMANKTYQRTLLLHTNSFPKVYSIPIQVQTAPIPIQLRHLPYPLVGLIFLGFGVAGWIVALILVMLGMVMNAPASLGFGALIGAAIGCQIAAWMLSNASLAIGSTTSVLAGVFLGGMTLLRVFEIQTPMVASVLPIGVAIGIVAGVFAGIGIGRAVERLIEFGLSKRFSATITLVTAATSFSLGLCLAPGLLTPLLTTITACLGILWVVLAAYFPLQRQKQIASYRQAEQYLIKP